MLQIKTKETKTYAEQLQRLFDLLNSETTPLLQLLQLQFGSKNR